MALDVDGIIAQLKDASILELNDLVKSIEDEFGVKAAAPVAAGAAAGADAAAAKDTYDVELTEAGQEKVKVIKEGLSEDDANKLKEQLEGVGATVTLK